MRDRGMASIPRHLQYTDDDDEEGEGLFKHIILIFEFMRSIAAKLYHWSEKRYRQHN